MYSYYGLFSIFSLFYALCLIFLFATRGFGQVIYPIIVFFASYNEFSVNEATNMYVINETLVPMWLFHPLNLFGGLLLAVIIFFFLKLDLD